MKEALGLAILSLVVRVDLIEMTFHQVPKEGEGVRRGPSYEGSR